MAQEIGWRSTSLFSGVLGALAATSLYHASSEAKAAGIVEGKLCSNCFGSDDDGHGDEGERRGLSSAAAVKMRSANSGSRYYHNSTAGDASSDSESWEESVGLLDRSASISQELRPMKGGLEGSVVDGLDDKEVSDHEAETPSVAVAMHEEAAQKPVSVRVCDELGGQRSFYEVLE